MFIPSQLSDNPKLLENDPGYINKLRASGSPQLVRAWLEGDWNVIEGAFFPEFSTARHIIQPFRVPDYWTRFRSMDWGSAKPFSVGWWTVVRTTSHRMTARPPDPARRDHPLPRMVRRQTPASPTSA